MFPIVQYTRFYIYQYNNGHRQSHFAFADVDILKLPDNQYHLEKLKGHS